MKFAHLADCHLGAWHQPELNYLNFLYFQKAIDICLKEKVEFILIAGDLFDSAYPSIETLKKTFYQFRRLKEKEIPVFIIAGSHDYSASGKTFLDVLENAGLCRNVSRFEKKENILYLIPTIFERVAIYGYPGKKSGLEVEELKNIKLHDTPGLFRILMLHTTLRSAVPNPNVKAVDDKTLPNVDYLALGHLHIIYNNKNKVYSGPIFPNNLPELEELGGGSFYIYESGKAYKIDLKFREVLVKNYKINDGLNATEEILEFLKNENLAEKIVIMKIQGILERGKTTNIDFKKIEEYCKKKQAFVVLKNTSKLYFPESELKLNLTDTENIEFEIIKTFQEKNPNKFNHLIPRLIKTFQIEKKEEEKNIHFYERIITEAKKIISI